MRTTVSDGVNESGAVKTVDFVSLVVVAFENAGTSVSSDVSVSGILSSGVGKDACARVYVFVSTRLCMRVRDEGCCKSGWLWLWLRLCSFSCCCSCPCVRTTECVRCCK